VPKYSEALYRAIVLVDVARFTDPKRKAIHLTRVHQGLEELLEVAFDEAGVGWRECDTEDRGDGKMILVPADVPKIRLVNQLSERLVEGLRRYNAGSSVESAMQLRVALHAGEIRLSPNGKVGEALNFAARLIEARAAKDSQAATGALLALITSERFYKDAIDPDPGLAPEEFQRIPVVVKETSGVAWLRLSGKPAKVADPQPASTPEPDAEVLDLVPTQALTELRSHLADVMVPELATLVRRAVGPAVPLPPPGAAVLDVVHHLADINADAVGFPPLLTFVELLARRLGGRLGDELRRWNDAQARSLRLEAELRARRATATSAADVAGQLHLLVVVEPDGIDPDRCLVSHWRQEDPEVWPPPRGEIRSAAVADLEHQVDDLVVSAEFAWASHDGPVALEIALPRALLTLPVHEWRKEYATGDPRPLYVDYPLVLRSLDRLKSPNWHRPWRQRWRTLMDDPHSATVCFSEPSNPGRRPHEMIAALEQGRQFAAMVLSDPPRAQPGPGDHLTAALRSGLPAVLWQHGGSSEGLKEVVARLAEHGGLAELPARAQALRRRASSGASEAEIARLDDEVVIHGLVVLWDDPRRVVPLDRLAG
jgi:hypothetical protein